MDKTGVRNKTYNYILKKKEKIQCFKYSSYFLKFPIASREF